MNDISSIARDNLENVRIYQANDENVGSYWRRLLRLATTGYGDSDEWSEDVTNALMHCFIENNWNRITLRMYAKENLLLSPSIRVRNKHLKVLSHFCGEGKDRLDVFHPYSLHVSQRRAWPPNSNKSTAPSFRHDQSTACKDLMRLIPCQANAENVWSWGTRLRGLAREGYGDSLQWSDTVTDAIYHCFVEKSRHPEVLWNHTNKKLLFSPSFEVRQQYLWALGRLCGELNGAATSNTTSPSNHST